MSSPNKGGRKRGIRASREKLDSALAKAGFRTQSALACHIADIEKTDSIPTDMVNRVFREKSVSHSSIQRVANGLGIEDVTSLYIIDTPDAAKTPSADIALAVTAPEIEVEYQELSASRFRPTVWLAATCVLLIIGIIFGFTVKDSKVNETPDANQILNVQPSLGGLSVSIIVDDDLYTHKTKIEDALDSINPVVIAANRLASHNLTTEQHQQILDVYQSDLLVVISGVAKNKHALIQAMLTDGKNEVLFWQRFSFIEQLSANNNAVWEDLAAHFSEIVENQGQYKAAIVDMPETSSKLFLEGVSLLQQSRTTLNVQSAQSRFMFAISEAPEFAEPYAGLCRAMLFESWTSDEQASLKSAQEFCTTALNKNSSSPYVVSSNALMLAATGQYDEAISLIQESLPTFDTDPELTYAMAVILHQRSQTDAAEELDAQNAILYAQQTLATLPFHWQTLNTLAQLFLSKGDLETALSYMELAASHTENQLLLTNIGVLTMCRGDLGKAKDYFKRVINLSPTHYFGYEQTSLALRFEGRYEQALAMQEQAIATMEEVNIHPIWGNLADLYLLTGRAGKAETAFNNALRVVGQYELRGVDSLAEKAFKLYYEYRLETIAEQSALDLNQYENQLNALINQSSSLPPSAQIRLGQLLALMNSNAKAVQLIKQATDTCPSYANLEWVKNLESKTKGPNI